MEDQLQAHAGRGLALGLSPPFHEVRDRWSYLNPSETNPATGTSGALEFAGNYGGAGVSCGCRTPVQTYWKNFGPRLGLTFASNPKTVWRAGVGHVFSQGGGVGGRVGAANGTGGLGFNTTATSPNEVISGSNAGPSFYLNNSSYFQSVGKANTALFAGNSYPAAPVPSAASVILNTGNYVGGPPPAQSAMTEPSVPASIFRRTPSPAALGANHMDRIERSDTTLSQRHLIHAYGVYMLPFGTGMLGGQNVISRQVLSGWQLGGILTFGTGSPLAITAATCSSPGQGQCMPDLNSAFTGNARIGGGYGRGSDGRRTACSIGLGTIDGTLGGTACSATTTATKYIDANGFAAAKSTSGAAVTTATNQLLGNAPRIGAYHLTGPNSTDLDMNIKRTFKLHDAMNLQIEADCVNVANHTIFSGPNVSYGNAAFGTVSGVSNKPRSFQIAGHFNF